MAALTGNTIASTYLGVLNVTGVVGADTVEAVTDGAGTSTSLSLSQQRATITLGSGAADDFIVDGTTLVVEGDNNRVGIGTAAPDATLHIVSAAEGSIADTGTNVAQLVVECTGHAGGSAGPHIALLTSGEAMDNDYIGMISFLGDDDVGDAAGDTSVATTYAGILAQILDETESGTTTDGALFFQAVVNDTLTTHMYMGGGNVGIGSTTPVTLLEVRGPAGTGAACAGVLTLSTAETSNAVGTVDQLGRIEFTAPLSAGASDSRIPGASIYAEVAEDFSNVNNSTSLYFCTATTSAAIERMKITQDGTIHMGQAGGAYSLNVNGRIWASTGIVIGADSLNNTIDDSSGGSGTTTLYIGNASITVSSDKRIKKDIVDTKSNGLEVVNKFRVVDFTWDDPTDQCVNNRNARGEWTGFLAQEAVEVAPYSVNAPRPEGKDIDYDSENIWGMNYEQLVPILAKAIQELSAKVTALENA